MRTMFICFTLAFSVAINAAYAQSKHTFEYPEQSPGDLMLDRSISRSYHITTDYMDYDLMGNFLRKTTIEGDYTTGLEGDSVRWNNVFDTSTDEEGQPFSEKKDFLENFTYLPTPEIVNPHFFQNMPEDEGFRMKNLIWDMFMLQDIAYWYWDSLRLNRDFDASELNESVDLAGNGTFENKNFKLKWLGTTRMNDDVYAIIKYSTMNNKVNIEMENLSMRGRSHYWGEVYVSLTDKHVEYATLTEDVITDLSVNGQPGFKGYVVRFITLSRTK